MNIDRSKLADISEIVSSIAILITLIYLTIEINQNTNALNAQSREAVLNAAQLELQLLMENPHIINNATSTEPLTEEEQSELDSTFTLLLRAREFSWLQFQDSTIDELQWDTEFAVLLSILDTDRVRIWWDKQGQYIFGQRFVDFVDQTIEENEATNEIWFTSRSWAN